MSSAALAAVGCNGSTVLCDRSLPEVALPATHNSMPVPLPGWYSSEQDHPIAQQLRDGIRELLIDTHYADRLSSGRLRTDVDTQLDSVLNDIRDFLVANPGAILVVINQDYVAAIRTAGLECFVYRGQFQNQHARNQRVLVPRREPCGLGAVVPARLSGGHRGDALRAQPSRAADRPRRAGGQLPAQPRTAAGAAVSRQPLDHSNAGKVNAYQPLLRRLKECQRIRGHLPNLVAVNFHARGALLEAVDALNGVP